MFIYCVCKCHKINPNRDGSYTDSTDWIKNKKATINPINEKDQCFQYAVKHEEIKDLQRRKIYVFYK